MESCNNKDLKSWGGDSKNLQQNIPLLVILVPLSSFLGFNYNLLKLTRGEAVVLIDKSIRLLEREGKKRRKRDEN